MPLPALVQYATPEEYRAHYKRSYCSVAITTFDGIRVYFKERSFDHAFYESTRRDGNKDSFSVVRAQRIDWIGATLGSAGATLYSGFDKQTNSYDETRRVAVVYGDFVVVVGMSLTNSGALKANFVTAYDADNSIAKIRNSPTWDRAICLSKLAAR